MNINKEIDFSNEMRPSASPPLTYPKDRIKCNIQTTLLYSLLCIRSPEFHVQNKGAFGTNSTATNNNTDVFVHFSYPEIFVC